MEKLNNLYIEIKPILHTYVFELKKNSKKFIIFSIITGLIGFLIGFLGFALIPEDSLSSSQGAYFQDGLGIMSLILIFGVCFFFGGIICSEFSTKSGYIVFPKINKYKLIIGKYLGNITLLIGVIAIYYFILVLLGIFFYGLPLNIRIFHSFAITILYILAVSSFVTLFSSFMKSVNMTIIATILILLIVFSLVDQIVVLSNPDFEPIYSLDFMSRLITSILETDFPATTAERYIDMEMQGFIFRIWITPTIQMGITVMLLYTIICLGLASIIFSRKQL